MKRGRAQSVDLLAVVAHPDDAELSCGGTLAGAVRRGYRVGVLDLTRGEMGTRGTPETRAREARAAARSLGLHHRENLGLLDAGLEPTRSTILTVAARVRALRPRVVILPYWEGRHPDHVAASHIGYRACYRSQFDAPKMQRGVHIPLTGLEERLDAICRYYGSLVGVRYGEPFLTRELLPVDDVLQLPGRSL